MGSDERNSLHNYYNNNNQTPKSDVIPEKVGSTPFRHVLGFFNVFYKVVLVGSLQPKMVASLKVNPFFQLSGASSLSASKRMDRRRVGGVLSG